ncbi:hypothetical protein LTR08_008211 [Meristemomyces frigidus]|nr:hypothetical protein LTR08_008211 [Meristemomyces frigidus]
MQGDTPLGQSCAHCREHGKSACKGCLLVVYCGPQCQKAHWCTHKQDCRSSLNKDNWKPEWERQGRPPTFSSIGPSQQSFGRNKFFWGNVPAIDVLRMDQNEGEDCDKDIRLLFAASGDPRNVIQTIASVPQGYDQSLHAHINDKDFDIVARNAIMLLVLLTVPDTDKAAECVVHIWYSACIRQTDLDILRDQVRPLVEDICKKIVGKKVGTMLGKTWPFANRALRLVLKKELWTLLLDYLEVPKGLTAVLAQRIRVAVTLAPSRKDYYERMLIKYPPAHRVCINKFRELGILVPFGHRVQLFDIPNPTFYQTDEWPMKDAADPLDGWALGDILKVNTGPAANDIYGKLFLHVRELVSSFHRRIESLNVSFELSNCAAEDLSNQLSEGSFARVEVSNICDRNYLGCAKTVASLGPLLQRPHTNTHATLLMLFMNAVPEMAAEFERAGHADTSAEMLKVSSHLGRTFQHTGSAYDSGLMGLVAARPIFRDVDKFFDTYMDVQRFDMIQRYYAMTMKNTHTIVDKWPTMPKLRPGEVGARKEIDVLIRSAHSGNERYVEWRRAFSHNDSTGATQLDGRTQQS